MGKSKFTFRGQECSYDYGWVSKNEFQFDFNLLGNKDFIDHEGSTYFMHCQYFNVDEELCSHWCFERWYEYESVNAFLDFFPDNLTENECNEIKEFMIMLMNQ